MRIHLSSIHNPVRALFLELVLLLAIGGCRGAADGQSPPAESDEATDRTAVGTRPDPAAPQGENLERPLGWQVRLDRPDPDAVIGSAENADVFFVNMTPGWHVTTKKAAIFYHPASTAEGEFTAKLGVYFFPPGDRQREGYGMIVGGSDLDSETQAYGYFLLRNTGEFLIKRRDGGETYVVQDWTPSDAIAVVEEGSEDSVLNELSVRAAGDQVHFVINGENVATHPRSALPIDGIVGLRLNHGVNVHVADLSVE